MRRIPKTMPGKRGLFLMGAYVPAVFFLFACFDSPTQSRPESPPEPLPATTVIIEAVAKDSLPAHTEPDPACTYAPDNQPATGNGIGDFFPMTVGNAWLWSDSIRVSSQGGTRRLQSEAGGTLMATLVQSACEGGVLVHTFRVKRHLTETFWTGTDQSPAPARPDSIHLRKLDTLFSCTEAREGVACSGFAPRIPILDVGPVAHRIPQETLKIGIDPFTGASVVSFLEKDSLRLLRDVGLFERVKTSVGGTGCCGEARKESVRLVSFQGIRVGNAERRTPVLGPSWADMAPLQAGNRWEYSDSGSYYSSGYGESTNRHAAGTIGIALLRSTLSDSGANLVFRVNRNLEDHLLHTSCCLGDTTTVDSIWSDTSKVDVFCSTTPGKLHCDYAALPLDMLLPNAGRFVPVDSLTDTAHVLTGIPGRNALQEGNPVPVDQKRATYMREVGLTRATEAQLYPGRFSSQNSFEEAWLLSFNGVSARP
jgi:hypothetical protein